MATLYKTGKLHYCNILLTYGVLLQHINIMCAYYRHTSQYHLCQCLTDMFHSQCQWL